MSDPRYTRLVISNIPDTEPVLKSDIIIKITTFNTSPGLIKEFLIYQASSYALTEYSSFTGQKAYGYYSVSAPRNQFFESDTKPPTIEGFNALDALKYKNNRAYLFKFVKLRPPEGKTVTKQGTIDIYDIENNILKQVKVNYVFDSNMSSLPKIYYITLNQRADQAYLPISGKIYIKFIVNTDTDNIITYFGIIGLCNNDLPVQIPENQEYIYDPFNIDKKPTYISPNQYFGVDYGGIFPVLECDVISKVILPDQQYQTPKGKYRFEVLLNVDYNQIQCLKDDNMAFTPPYACGYIFSDTDPTSGCCFSEGTKILCYTQLENSLISILKEEYRLVQHLKIGELVKSYLHGYRKVSKLLKGSFVNNPNEDGVANCMYIMKKTKDNGLIEDLTLTRNHGVLVEKLSKDEEKKIDKNNLPVIDGLLSIITADSDKFEKVMDMNRYNYYHFSLDGDGDNDRRFGVWANGILMETMP